MKRGITILAMWALFLPVGAFADDCEALSSQLRLPAKVKTKGKPKRVRWGKVNKIMNELSKATESQSCSLTFADVFAPKKSDVYFPILGSVIKTVPEESLKGLSVYYLDGSKAGSYSNRVIFEKTGYNQYYFQFETDSGRLETSGKDLIEYTADKPVFLLKWEELRDRLAISAITKNDD